MITKIHDRPEAAAERWRLAIRRVARIRTLAVCLAAVVTVCAFVVVFEPTYCPNPVTPSSFVFAAVMVWIPAWGADSNLKTFKKLRDLYERPAA